MWGETYLPVMEWIKWFIWYVLVGYLPCLAAFSLKPRHNETASSPRWSPGLFHRRKRRRREKNKPALPGSAKWCSFSSGTLSFLFLSVSLRMLRLVAVWFNIRHGQSDSLAFTREWQCRCVCVCLCAVVVKYCVSFSWTCVFFSSLILVVSRLCEMCCDWTPGKIYYSVLLLL